MSLLPVFDLLPFFDLRLSRLARRALKGVSPL